MLQSGTPLAQHRPKVNAEVHFFTIALYRLGDEIASTAFPLRSLLSLSDYQLSWILCKLSKLATQFYEQADCLIKEDEFVRMKRPESNFVAIRLILILRITF